MQCGRIALTIGKDILGIVIALVYNTFRETKAFFHASILHCITKESMK